MAFKFKRKTKMPIYEYLCTKCCARFEVVQKSSEARLRRCEKCGSPLKKLVSAPAIQFKGNGWYITDYAKKPAAEKESKSEGKAKPAATPPASSSDSPGSDKKN